jgi:hypothetical protein
MPDLLWCGAGRRSAAGAAIAMLMVSAAACGGGSNDAAPVSNLPPPPEVAPGQAASITGTVRYQGEAPKPVPISMDAVPACARQHSEPPLSEELLVNDDGTLRNVFVWIKQGLRNYAWPQPLQPATLDQRGCIFRPHVLAVMVNQPLEIFNSDSSNHNINLMARLNRPFNESQPPQGEKKVKRFSEPEVMITIRCNVHPWMRAYLAVVPHPYYRVTENGRYAFEGLPPGEYVIEAWHEKFGARQSTVKVEAADKAVADFEFSG